jgi:hypothetical protein
MQTFDFEQYQSDAKSRGFDEVAPRDWPANTTSPIHTHPFSVEGLVVKGEMWLTVDEETKHLKPGDRFTLALEKPHMERYGADGTTYWAARRNGR